MAAKNPLVGYDLPSLIHVHFDEHRIFDHDDFFGFYETSTISVRTLIIY